MFLSSTLDDRSLYGQSANNNVYFYGIEPKLIDQENKKEKQERLCDERYATQVEMVCEKVIIIIYYHMVFIECVLLFHRKKQKIQRTKNRN